MIKEINFSHIRSYGENNHLEFAVPEEGRLGLTVLVGKNNAGKSTILRLISDAFDEKPNMIFDKLDRKPGNDPSVDFRFSWDGVDCAMKLSKAASAYFRKDITKIEDESTINVNGVGRGGDPFLAFVPSRRPWNDSFNSENRASQNLQQFETTARGRVQNQLADLGNQLNRIIADGKKVEFDRYLKFVMPEINDWTTDRVAGQDKIVYQSKSKVEHAINDSGDGVVSLFRICFAILRYDDKRPLLLDEPELSLHPEAQKRLYDLIVDVARKRQVIASTHSPHFVEWKHIAEGAKIFRVAQDDEGVTQIFSPTEKTFRKIIKFTTGDPKNRRLYDYLAKEMFFQSKIVFVEGPEDVHIISLFLEREGVEPLPLFSYGAGGAGNIKHLLRLADELGLRSAGLYDGNKRDDFEIAQADFLDNKAVKCFVLDRDDIRDKYMRDGDCAVSGRCEETGERLVDGYFDREWNVREDGRQEFVEILGAIAEHLNDTT